MRCVFDTNVLVSALLVTGSVPCQAFMLARNRGTILLSYTVLAELYEVLGRPRLRRYLDEGDVRNFLAALTHQAEWIDINIQIRICRDPKDDKFLELAVSGAATHLVTGDQDLLALNPFQNVAIVSPGVFIRLYANGSSVG